MEDTHHLHHSFMHQEQTNQDIHCNNLTHVTTLENLISLSGKPHILENAASLANGGIDYSSYNTTSLYLEKIFSALNCSTDPLINELS